MADHYPMPAFPTLWVKDVMISSKWYQRIGGFEVVFELPGPDRRLRLAHMRRGKYQDVMLVADPPGFNVSPEYRGRGVTLTFAIDEDLESFANRARERGGHILAGPGDQTWNAREIIMSDPDGYRLIFSKRSAVEKDEEGFIDVE
ncbi:MAG: VOC family protein [Acidobacteriota bacterium]